MIVSFFKDGTYATGIDCSKKEAIPWVPAILDEEAWIILDPGVPATPETGNDECILVCDVDFDTETQELSLEDGNVKVYAKIPLPEYPDERKARILAEITLENIDDIDVDFQISDIEIGDLIVKLIFNGNPHAQNALQARVLGMILSGNQSQGFIETVQETQAKINKIRSKFKLSPL